MSEATKVVGLVCAAGVGSRMGLGSPKQYMKFGSEAMLVHTVRALRAVERMGEIVPTQLILQRIWGDDTFFNARSLHVFITRLRRLLAADPSVQIVNARGVGYRLHA